MAATRSRSSSIVSPPNCSSIADARTQAAMFSATTQAAGTAQTSLRSAWAEAGFFVSTS
jgi:hypothetical protein